MDAVEYGRSQSRHAQLGISLAFLGEFDAKWHEVVLGWPFRQGT